MTRSTPAGGCDVTIWIERTEDLLTLQSEPCCLLEHKEIETKIAVGRRKEEVVDVISDVLNLLYCTQLSTARPEYSGNENNSESQKYFARLREQFEKLISSADTE